jgi:predicted deacylase
MLTLAGESISAGSRRIVRIPITQDAYAPLELCAHVVNGRRDGPTLLLLSMLHGNEWFSVLIIRELLRALDPESLSGAVIAIPVANPTAAATGTRCVMDDSDEPDANRAFGGGYHWTTNLITRAIEERLFSVAAAVIDYHVSDWGSTMADVSYVEDYSSPAVAAASRDMALAVGFPALHALRIFKGARGARTSLGCAGERYNIPGIVIEIGGLGFGDAIEAAWLQRNVDGTMNVMRRLGMLDGEPPRLDRYLRIEDYWRVSPRAGGYLEAVVGLDRQFTETTRDELLARVVSPTSLEVVDELRAPGRGVLFYMCRSHMTRPGGWAFGVANLEEGKARWVSA